MAKPDSPKVLEIKQKVAEVLESRKNANNIVDIIGHLEVTAHSSAAKAAINGVKRIFSLALERREVEEGKEGEETAEAKYKGWVYDRLLETVKKLCAVLQHSQTSVSSLALATLLSFMRSAHQAGGTGGVRAAWGPLERQVLHSVVLTLVSTKRDVKGVVVRLAELLGFSDVKQHLLRILKKTITTATAGGKVNNFFIDNVINVLEVVDLGCLDSAHTLLCRLVSHFFLDNLVSGTPPHWRPPSSLTSSVQRTPSLPVGWASSSRGLTSLSTGGCWSCSRIRWSSVASLDCPSPGDAPPLEASAPHRLPALLLLRGWRHLPPRPVLSFHPDLEAQP